MAEDLTGGPGWIISGHTLRPVITDFVAFRESRLQDPLAAVIEQLWSGQPHQALDLLSAQDPSPRVRALRGDCLRDLARHTEAINVYQQLVQESVDGPAEAVMRQHYGKALLAAGHVHAAKHEFARALELRIRGSNEDLIASSRQALQVAAECCAD
ncbi:hypothetical protein [Allobranchiibius sp. GilTou38]|uniref:hypothetical protein n=1 Tax=Allobranchiibius sp. GilTou38 TaxID=2815210 RepID=UPI001AA0ED97|nr:hypothetical protein [Allobranchiibius sp. GilTou38]MBO1766448.1 hypothetical protein [Allobranchiibius sp. GilTou38]